MARRTFLIHLTACFLEAWQGDVPQSPALSVSSRSSEESQKQPQPKWAWVCDLRMALPTSLPLSLASPPGPTHLPRSLHTTWGSFIIHKAFQACLVFSRELLQETRSAGGIISILLL